jgi:hypothetical protein
MAKKIVKEEEVKIPSKKIIVKEEFVNFLDENKNVIKTPIQVIVEEKTINEEVEQKIVTKTKLENFTTIDFEIDNTLNNSFMEIEAEVMKEDDDDDIFTEPVIKRKKENKNIINNNVEEKNELSEVINEEKPKDVQNKNIKSEDVKIIQYTPSVPLQKEILTEVFHYNASDKEKLIQDKPSVPLQAEGLTGKKLYDSYLGKKYVMYYNGELLYDSEKSYYFPVFHNDFFELYSIKYSYRGLRIKIKD